MEKLTSFWAMIIAMSFTLVCVVALAIHISEVVRPQYIPQEYRTLRAWNLEDNTISAIYTYDNTYYVGDKVWVNMDSMWIDSADSVAMQFIILPRK